jgi:signal transduction histidine kinase
MTILTALARLPHADLAGRAAITTNAAGVIRDLTPAAEQLLGHTYEDLVGRSLSSLVVGADLDGVFAAVRGRMVPFDQRRWTYVSGDAAHLVLNTTVSAAYGRDEEVSFVLLLEDLDDPWPPVRLVPANDDDEMRLSRELRTPLAVILGYTEILRSLDAGPLNALQHSILAKVEENTRQLIDMLQSTMREHTLASASVAVGPEEVSLTDVVERCVESIAGQLHDKRLRLALDLDAGPAAVMGSAQHLEVLVDHLLSNAVRCTPDGGLLSVTLVLDGDGWALVVADSGCGIPAEELPHVFTQFFQSSSSTTQPRFGSGLGLSTAQTIAAMHGGRIEVDSAVGQGSEFVVHLPAAVSPAPAA